MPYKPFGKTEFLQLRERGFKYLNLGCKLDNKTVGYPESSKVTHYLARGLKRPKKGLKNCWLIESLEAIKVVEDQDEHRLWC